MPEEAFFSPDEENALQWFLRGISDKTLSAQVTFFILLALESNSDKEVRLVLIKFMKWLASFDRKLKGKERASREVQLLLKKLYVECLVFCVPFFWPDRMAYKRMRASLINKDAVLL